MRGLVVLPLPMTPAISFLRRHAPSLHILSAHHNGVERLRTVDCLHRERPLPSPQLQETQKKGPSHASGKRPANSIRRLAERLVGGETWPRLLGRMRREPRTSCMYSP
jgi:hypothetical protein